MDADFKKALDGISEILINLKCCGNCINHSINDNIGECDYRKILTHSCYCCDEWKFDNMNILEREKFELPKEK